MGNLNSIIFSEFFILKREKNKFRHVLCGTAMNAVIDSERQTEQFSFERFFHIDHQSYNQKPRRIKLMPYNKLTVSFVTRAHKHTPLNNY